MGGKLAWFRFYAADFTMDTLHLSTEQVGAYVLLLAKQWVDDSLPESSDQLARISRVEVERFKRSVWSDIGQYFEPDGCGNLVNKRLERARTAEDRARAERKRQAKKAAKIRWSKSNADNDKDAASNAGAMLMQCSDHASQSQSIEKESRDRAEKVGNQASERLSHLELGSELPRARESEERVAGEEGFSTAVAELANGMNSRPKIEDLEAELRETRKRHLHDKDVDHRVEAIRFLLPLYINGSSKSVPDEVRMWMGRISAVRIMDAIRDMETGHFEEDGEELPWSRLSKDRKRVIVQGILNPMMGAKR